MDISDAVNESDFIPAKIGDQDTKLFIVQVGERRPTVEHLQGYQRDIVSCVQGIKESTHFAPHVKYEIGEYAWYRVDELPARSVIHGGWALTWGPPALPRCEQRQLMVVSCVNLQLGRQQGAVCQ